LNSPVLSDDLSYRQTLSGEPMCDQCQRIQEQILHYGQFLTQRFDVLTKERVKQLIADLQRQKEAMHC